MLGARLRGGFPPCVSGGAGRSDPPSTWMLLQHYTAGGSECSGGFPSEGRLVSRAKGDGHESHEGQVHVSAGLSSQSYPKLCRKLSHGARYIRLGVLGPGEHIGDVWWPTPRMNRAEAVVLKKLT